MPGGGLFARVLVGCVSRHVWAGAGEGVLVVNPGLEWLPWIFFFYCMQPRVCVRACVRRCAWGIGRHPVKGRCLGNRPWLYRSVVCPQRLCGAK